MSTSPRTFRPARGAGRTRHRASTILGATLLGAALTAGFLPTAHADQTSAAAGTRAAAAQRVTVDLAAPEGEVLRGANGALYGLSDDGVPSDAALAPLKLTTVSQKAEGGAQHPNGDAVTVSKSFFRNGGGDVLVMMQDIYAQWPYEDLGIDDYLTKVDKIARDVANAPNSEHFVYVPFNEPDQIWYHLGVSDQATYQTNRDRFLKDWKTVYQRIRAIDPDARIAGPNEASYHTRLLTDFLTFAKKENVLPEVTTWHELSPSSLRDFQSHFDTYRAIEKSVGITPRTVNINEYANRRDLSVPGQLVQWVSMFERNKVYADQAYWDAAGNLDGNVVRTNIPNGGWWFFRWYAGLTGRTVKVTPPSLNTVDTLQGLASLDTTRKQAQVLLGGAAGDADVAVQHVDPAVFGTSVTATVAEAAWSGYEGQHAAPRVLSRTKLTVAADGSVTVPLTGMKQMSAYRIVLTPAGSGTPAAATVPWSASYEAEDARITGGQVYTQGTVSNANGYATSGTKDVGSLNTSGSKVDFTVTVPTTGGYDLSVLYGNQSGAPATQLLSVDGGATTGVRYPSTENWTYRAKADLTVALTAGTHTLTLAKGTGEVTLDRIDLTANTTPAASYEATLADISGSVSYDYTDASGTGTGALVLGSGAKAVYDVYAPRDGYYTVTSRASAAVQLALHEETVTAAPGQALRLYLVAGNNRVTATGSASLRSLDVSGTGSTTGTLAYDGAQARLAGGARLVDSAHATEGSYIGWLGNSAASTATFTVDAPRAGKYLLVLTYGQNDRRDNGHAYNTDIVSRTADVTVGANTRKVTFKNTWSWEDFWTLGVPVTLQQGANTLTLSNASAWAPNIDRVELAPVRG
ncbi:CBM35 domain-containing protein [Streptomyces corynorhini]|uniref:Cellulosome protein n=1 Tax=Streptomyces corynorhini TaxID=2282652 RepID=A0A370BFC4_9ACTN|nr:CBM35 domain-containing protein [Streptomyces corynorhini]RDG39089.1 cellulosome protein [Streptomyces corynorhini]